MKKTAVFKISILFIIFLFIQANSLLAQDSLASIKPITDEDIASFKEQAVRDIYDLNSYISMMCNKAASANRKKFARNMAIKLFYSDSATVQISRADKSIKTEKISTYFNNLICTKYSNVNITFYEVYISKDFKPGPNGKYYGTATYTQKFEVSSNGKEDPRNHPDITEKNVQLVIEPITYQDGNIQTYWVLKLGDINVTNTE